MPGVCQTKRWLPDLHPSPLVLHTRRRPLEDAAAHVLFEYDPNPALTAHGVVERPPHRRTRRPRSECCLGRTMHLERQFERLGHGAFSSTFSATMRNLAAASPHTAS